MEVCICWISFGLTIYLFIYLHWDLFKNDIMGLKKIIDFKQGGLYQRRAYLNVEEKNVEQLHNIDFSESSKEMALADSTVFIYGFILKLWQGYLVNLVDLSFSIQSNPTVAASNLKINATGQTLNSLLDLLIKISIIIIANISVLFSLTVASSLLFKKKIS